MRSVITIVLVLAMTGLSQSQTDNHLLKGANDFKLIIDVTGNDASKACGVTHDIVRYEIMYPASSARFRLPADRTTSLRLVVALHTLNPPGFCFTNITMNAYAAEWVAILETDYVGPADVVLWSRWSVHSSSPSNHRSQVKAAIEEGMKKFVTDWNLDNKAEEGAAGASPK
jgi:hypothetical protein